MSFPHNAKFSQCRACQRRLALGVVLEHDAKKWLPVFRKIMRQINNKEQIADSSLLHFALGPGQAVAHCIKRCLGAIIYAEF